eukprot:10831-Heterococcus_DN1.PRE.1
MDAALSQLQADNMCIFPSEQTRTAEAGAMKDSLDPEVQAKMEAEQRASDRKAAMHQLHAAAVVHTARASCVTSPEIKAVKDAFMAPPQLAHFMKAAFGVKLTAGQLAAMFELFDADGSGEQCLLQCCAICSARTVF